MAGGSHYERLGVPLDADTDTLRRAYRQLARLLHPDVNGALADGGEAMAQVNEAWRILSDPARRSAYDATLQPPAARPATDQRRSPPGSSASRPPAPAARPASPRPAGGPTSRPLSGARREAWLISVRYQIRRLATQAARSAVQTAVTRHLGVPRERYDALVEPIVTHLLADTENRVREARAAGAAPLDLANGAALLGLRAYAERLASSALDAEQRGMAAALIDRMWDTMAHELPRELEQALGGNPRASRRHR